MTPLALHLMRRSPRLTEVSAERLAARIIADKAERARKERKAIRAANPELPFAEEPATTPTAPDEVIDF